MLLEFSRLYLFWIITIPSEVFGTGPPRPVVEVFRDLILLGMFEIVLGSVDLMANLLGRFDSWIRVGLGSVAVSCYRISLLSGVLVVVKPLRESGD